MTSPIFNDTKKKKLYIVHIQDITSREEVEEGTTIPGRRWMSGKIGRICRKESGAFWLSLPIPRKETGGSQPE